MRWLIHVAHAAETVVWYSVQGVKYVVRRFR